MAKNGRKVRKIAKMLGASRVARVKKGWDWKMTYSAEKKLCVCGTANRHLPHCPYNKKIRKTAKVLGASWVAVKKGWDWRLASLAEKELCICGDATRHLPHCPYDEVGVDFSDMQKVLKKMERDFRKSEKPRNPKRISKILKELERIWKRYPDLRLCQLIVNAIHEGSLYYCEDEELIKLLRKFYSKKNRHV